MTPENTSQYLKVLHDNERGVNQSFIYFLNQEDSFNAQAFWQLYNSLIAVIEKPLANTVDRQLARTLCRIEAYILTGIIQHLSPEETATTINNFPAEKIEAYIERLAYAVDGYFTGLIIDEKLLEQSDGLRNPKTHGE